MIWRLFKGWLVQALVVGSILLALTAIFLQLAGHTAFVQNNVGQLRAWWSGATTAAPRDAAESTQLPVPDSLRKIQDNADRFQDRINRSYSGAVEVLEPTPE